MLVTFNIQLTTFSAASTFTFFLSPSSTLQARDAPVGREGRQRQAHTMALAVGAAQRHGGRVRVCCVLCCALAAACFLLCAHEGHLGEAGLHPLLRLQQHSRPACPPQGLARAAHSHFLGPYKVWCGLIYKILTSQQTERKRQRVHSPARRRGSPHTASWHRAPARCGSAPRSRYGAGRPRLQPRTPSATALGLRLKRTLGVGQYFRARSYYRRRLFF